MHLSFRENMMLAMEHKEPQYMPLITDFDQVTPGALDFINESPAISGVHKDWFGQSWTFEPNIGGANPTPGCYLLEDVTEWKQKVRFPDLGKLNWADYAARDTAGWDREHRMSRVIIGYGMWERLFSIMPFTDALVSLVEEPEACYDFFGAVADHKIRLHDYVIQHYKPDIIVMHDDYGNNSNLFMSVETWRELLKPHLKRVIEAVTSKDVLYEHHCCGYIAPLLPEIVEMGATSYNTVHVSNRPLELKKQLGDRLTFVGGFNNQFIDSCTTTEEQIRVHVRETIDALAPGGSWVPRVSQKTKGRADIVTDELLKYGCSHYYSPRPEL